MVGKQSNVSNIDGKDMALYYFNSPRAEERVIEETLWQS